MAAALAASPSARCVQDCGTRTSVACWSSSCVPRRRLSPSVGRGSSPTAVQLQLQCGSCSCRKHITNSVIGEFLGRRSSTVERPSTWSMAVRTYLQLLQTISENSFIWRPKRLVTLLNVYINKFIYLSI